MTWPRRGFPSPQRLSKRLLPAAALACLALACLAMALPLAADTNQPAGGAVPTAEGDPLADRAMLGRLKVGHMSKFRFADAARPVADIAPAAADGRATPLSAWRGKTLLLNVWASWCAPCKEEMASLVRLQSALAADGLAVVALSIDKTPEPARAFLDRHALGALAALFDPGAVASRRLGVVGVPTTILIDGQGRELGRIESGVDWASDTARLLVKAMIVKSTAAAR